MKTLKKNLDKILWLCAAVFALVAVLLMFAPAGVIEALNTKTTYTGAQMAFGYKEPVLTGSVTIFGASANILTYILLVLGIVALAIAALGKGGKIPGLVAAACFIAAGVLAFCVIPLSVTDLKDALKLGAGAICSGVFGICAALICVVNLFIKPKKK